MSESIGAGSRNCSRNAPGWITYGMHIFLCWIEMESAREVPPARHVLEKKSARKQIPDGIASALALQAGVAPEILINFYLDSAVLRSALRSLVVSDRFGLAKSLT